MLNAYPDAALEVCAPTPEHEQYRHRIGVLEKVVIHSLGHAEVLVRICGETVSFTPTELRNVGQPDFPVPDVGVDLTEE